MTENIEQQSNWRTKQKALQQLTLLNLSICTILSWRMVSFLDYAYCFPMYFRNGYHSY